MQFFWSGKLNLTSNRDHPNDLTIWDTSMENTIPQSTQEPRMPVNSGLLILPRRGHDSCDKREADLSLKTKCESIC